MRPASESTLTPAVGGRRTGLPCSGGCAWDWPRPASGRHPEAGVQLARFLSWSAGSERGRAAPRSPGAVRPGETTGHGDARVVVGRGSSRMCPNVGRKVGDPQTVPRRRGVGRAAGLGGGAPASARGGVPASARGGVPASARGGVPASARGGVPASARGGVPASARGGVPASAPGGAVGPSVMPFGSVEGTHEIGADLRSARDRVRNRLPVQEPAGHRRSPVRGRDRLARALPRHRRRGAALGGRGRPAAATGARAGAEAALVGRGGARAARDARATASIAGARARELRCRGGGGGQNQRRRRLFEQGKSLHVGERAPQLRGKPGEHGSEHMFYGRQACGRNRRTYARNRDMQGKRSPGPATDLARASKRRRAMRE